MDSSVGHSAREAALARAVAAVCEDLPLDLTEDTGDRLLLDLTKLEADVETRVSTMRVLVKHLQAA